MFKSNPSQGSGSSGNLNGLLDAGSHMTGELSFEDSFHIHGKLTGSIVSGGELRIGERGVVDGDIKVRYILVSGTVHGSLTATEKIEITATGKVYADIHSPKLAVEEGAVFEGSCSMKVPNEDAEAGRKKVTQMPGTKNSESL